MNYYLIITYKEEEKECFKKHSSKKDEDDEYPKFDLGEYYSQAILVNKKETIDIIEKSVWSKYEELDLKPLIDLLIKRIGNNYLKQAELFTIEKIIASLHFKGGKREEKIEIQQKLNRKLIDYIDQSLEDETLKDMVEKFKFVFHSTTDGQNVFAKGFYDYDLLFGKTLNDEEFSKFLKLLNARANGDEIRFFDIKKKINNLYHIFCVKALACKGILDCVENGEYENAKDYYSKSFEKKPFEEIVSELRKSNEIKELKNIKEYNKGTYDEIKQWLNKKEIKPTNYKNLALKNLEIEDNKGLLNDFIKWFVDFQTALIKLKEGESSEK